jgi:hypothetical protein
VHDHWQSNLLCAPTCVVDTDPGFPKRGLIDNGADAACPFMCATQLPFADWGHLKRLKQGRPRHGDGRMSRLDSKGPYVGYMNVAW